MTQIEECPYWRGDRHVWVSEPDYEAEWVRNATVGRAFIDGQEVPVSGYIERCKLCGTEYPVPVG